MTAGDDGTAFELVDEVAKWEGRIVTVKVARFRYPDGEVAEREIVSHPGAVAVIAHDEEHVWLVRQPREATGERALLELPAGKLDVEDEEPIATAQRELAEEIGKSASAWRHLKSFYVSAGFSDEVVHVFLASGLEDVEPPEVDEHERIEIVPWPLTELDSALDECKDSKTLIGLLMLRDLLRT
jgi:ADP-ribose pyrophosphatase